MTLGDRTTETLRVAQLSFWFSHADEVCRRAQETPGVELVAVWDSNADRGRTNAGRFEVPFEPDLDTLLGRQDIHAVSMCAEPGRHPDLAEQAAAAGKHMLIEKPIAADLAGAERIAHAAHRYPVQIMPAYNLRHHPLAQRVKQLVDDGALGDIVRVRRLHGHSLHEKFDYEPSRIVAGWGDAGYERPDSLFFAGTHSALWFEWMFGLPQSVLCVRHMAVPDLPVEDNATLILRYRTFVAVAEISETLLAQHAVTEIYGTDGVLIQQRGNLPSTRVFNPARTPLQVFDRHTDTWSVPDLPPHFLRHEARFNPATVFFTALLREEAVPTDAAAGLRSIALLVSAEEAAATGREVRLEDVLGGTEVTSI